MTKLEDVLPHNNHSEKNKKIVIFVAVGVVVFVALVLLCVCKKIRQKRQTTSLINDRNLTSSVTPPVYNISSEVQLRRPEDVARRYERSISNLSTKSQIYLVPFDVLPPNFDYSSRDVEVKGDYVILKDLSLLERNVDHLQGTINEAYEYEHQPAYNPLYVIPPLSREPYKKQPAYNEQYVY